MEELSYNIDLHVDPEYTFNILKEHFPSKYNDMVESDWFLNNNSINYLIYINKQLCDDGKSRWYLQPYSYSDCGISRNYDIVFIDCDIVIDILYYITYKINK